MKRLTTAALLELANSLAETERTIVHDLARLGLMSHTQLAALLCHESTDSELRGVRRQLKRLADVGVIARLERRIGGIRAGSAGYIYYLGPAGQRLHAYWRGEGFVRGRNRPEPAGRHIRHRLAVSELYMQLRLAERDGALELLTFDAEPDCWRVFSDGLGHERVVKPDAFVRLGVGAYEDRYFLEVDLATESRTVVVKKVRAYQDYWNSGIEQRQHGVFPRVLLLTNSEERRASLVKACTRLPAESWQLFTITTLDQALEVISDNRGHGEVDELEALS